MQTSQETNADLNFVLECADAYAKSTGLGCVVSDGEGAVLYETGLCCGNCAICEAVGVDKKRCPDVSVSNAYRSVDFDGKYVYLCGMGLGNIVFSMPISGGRSANVTAGPFLMNGMEDSIVFDMKENFMLEDSKLKLVKELLAQIPQILPGRVRSLLNLLYMLMGHKNAAEGVRDFYENGEAFARPETAQKKVAGYQSEEYPLRTEKKLLASIAESDRPKAQKLLNELLGHILFSSGDDFELVKAAIYELLVVVSRSAIDVGVPRSAILQLNKTFWRQAQYITCTCKAQSITCTCIYGLCMLLTDVVNSYIDYIFDCSSKKNLEVIYRAAQYIRQNYKKKITLEEVSGAVYLSPTYLCKIFKKEMGCNFNEYLNRLRIDHSKELLTRGDIRISDVMAAVGFDDQSYFTKVFKRVAGVSPKHFRRSAEAA